MEKNTTKNLIKQGSILVVASLIVRIMGLVYRIPITNLWGDHGLGTYGDAYQVYNFFLVFASFSIPTMMSKVMGERMAKKHYANAKKVFVLALLLVGGIGLFCMLLFRTHGIMIVLMQGYTSKPRPEKQMRRRHFLLCARGMIVFKINRKKELLWQQHHQKRQSFSLCCAITGGSWEI